METLNLLFVEDNPNEIKIFEDTLERYCKEKEPEINISVTKKSNLDESLKSLSNFFDGAIVDIKLNQDGDAGNKLIDKITKQYRIPVAIYTGNPNNVSVDITKEYVKVFTRASVKYDAPLDFLVNIYKTGVTKILGGRGDIERTLNHIFWNSIIPILEDWQAYNKEGINTEKVLLRFVVNHIVEILDNEAEFYFPEEVYITPSNSSSIKTGYIVKKKESNDYYVVLSPACDLVVRNNQIKTDRILVCLIDGFNIDLITKARKDLKTEISSKEKKVDRLKKIEIINRAKRIIEQIPKNTYSSFFHYLPKTKAFHGGIINFRKIETYRPNDYKKIFDSAVTQVSMVFVKDIVARFSSYYARQGQPDFDFENQIKKLSE